MAEQVAHVESQVASALVALSAEGWVVLHDVPVPGRRTPVDHVAVGPPGAYVVCSRPWQGRVRERDVAEALSSARAVTGVCPAPARDVVWPVLCFETAEPLDSWVHGVTIAAPSTLVDLVVARRTVLAVDEVHAVAAALEAQREPRSAPAATRAPGSHRADTGRRGVALRLVRRSGPVPSHQ